jgi:hypothetical protein
MGLTVMKYIFPVSFHHEQSFFDKTEGSPLLGFEQKLYITKNPFKMFVQHQNV